MLLRTRLVFAICVCASTAHADAPDPEALVKAGVELRREHRDADALDRFRQAYALTATPRIRAQIALAEQALGRWADAERDLDAAMAQGSDRWIAEHASVLHEAHAAIDERLGWLEVIVDAPDAQLVVNGERRGKLPLAAPIRVEAGSLVIDVQRDGYTAARRMTSVEPGGTARETIHLEPTTTPPASTRAPSPQTIHAARASSGVAMSERRGLRVTSANAELRATGFVLLGAAVADVVLGTYFGVRTLQVKSDRDGQCAASCTPLGVAFDGEARSLALRSSVWFGAGLVSVATGATFLWVSRSRSSSVGVVPWIGPDRAGGAVGGSF